MKVSREELEIRLALPLDEKIQWAIDVYCQFYMMMDGKVYSSFSGGKDSQVLVDIIERLHSGQFEPKNNNSKVIWETLILGKPSPSKVFCDTGLEYPEIRKHVKTFDNVVWMKPKMKFPDVVKTFGFAVASKDVAQKVSEIITTKSVKLLSKRLFGDSKGNGKLPDKWRKLLVAPFKVSGKCCDIFKKEPFRRYERLTGKKPIQGTTVEESTLRVTSYRKTGCNSFESGRERSRPLSIWTEDDVWAYAKNHVLRFADSYYEREVDGKTLPALTRTGCMFCLFGIHLDPKNKPNRFQLMKESHPRQYKFCIEDLGIGKVLDFIGIKY